MADLIDRNALLDNTIYDGCDVVYIDAILNAPTVDAVPMAHGRWIQLFGEWMEESLVGRVNKCSVCGRNIITDGIDKTGKALVATVNNPFCRWCGAKMDEECDSDAVD